MERDLDERIRKKEKKIENIAKKCKAKQKRMDGTVDAIKSKVDKARGYALSGKNHVAEKAIGATEKTRLTLRKCQKKGEEAIQIRAGEKERKQKNREEQNKAFEDAEIEKYCGLDSRDVFKISKMTNDFKFEKAEDALLAMLRQTKTILIDVPHFQELFNKYMGYVLQAKELVIYNDLTKDLNKMNKSKKLFGKSYTIKSQQEQFDIQCSIISDILNDVEGQIRQYRKAYDNQAVLAEDIFNIINDILLEDAKNRLYSFLDDNVYGLFYTKNEELFKNRFISCAKQIAKTGGEISKLVYQIQCEETLKDYGY